LYSENGDIWADAGNNVNLRAPGRSGVNGRLTGFFDKGFELIKGSQGTGTNGEDEIFARIVTNNQHDLLLQAGNNFDTGTLTRNNGGQCSSCGFNEQESSLPFESF